MLTLQKPASVPFEEMRSVTGVGRLMRTLFEKRSVWVDRQLRLDEGLARRAEPAVTPSTRLRP